MGFNRSFLSALPTASLRAEPQIQVLPPAAGKIDNGTKHTANLQSPRKIAAEVIEEDKFRYSIFGGS
ncbi:hypothetical protein QUA56_32900 [Microcoleus sp. N3A4]|uniref:hypothetical protein n=1 Tax=Microcoleus sp. N3A4 TaxID=3055379 RepID=UPI002FD5A770